MIFSTVTVTIVLHYFETYLVGGAVCIGEGGL